MDTIYAIKPIHLKPNGMYCCSRINNIDHNFPPQQEECRRATEDQRTFNLLPLARGPYVCGQ